MTEACSWSTNVRACRRTPHRRGTFTQQFSPNRQLGLALAHQTADVKGGRVSTLIGMGVNYEITEHDHLLADGAPGLQHAAETGRYFRFAAVLFTL